MLALDIGGNEAGTYSWADANLTLERTGSGTPNTWQFSAEVGGTVSSARDVTLNLLSWLNDASREWNGLATWSMIYAQGSAFGMKVTYTADAQTFDVTPTAAFDAITGIASGTGVSSFKTANGDYLAGTFYLYSGSSPVIGDTRLELANWLRHASGEGAMSPASAWTVGPQGTALRTPRLEFALTELECDYWSDRIATGANPRRAWVYQDHTSTWRQVSLGQASVDRVTDNHWLWRYEINA